MALAMAPESSFYCRYTFTSTFYKDKRLLHFAKKRFMAEIVYSLYIHYVLIYIYIMHSDYIYSYILIMYYILIYIVIIWEWIFIPKGMETKKGISTKQETWIMCLYKSWGVFNKHNYLKNAAAVGTQLSFAVLFYTAPKSNILLNSDKCSCFYIIILDSCMSILFTLTVIVTKRWQHWWWSWGLSVQKDVFQETGLSLVSVGIQELFQRVFAPEAWRTSEDTYPHGTIPPCSANLAGAEPVDVCVCLWFCPPPHF